MTADIYSMLYTVGGMVIGGGLVHGFKRYTEQSDSQEKIIPGLLKSIETVEKNLQSCCEQLETQALALPVITNSIKIIEEATAKMKDSIRELYESRNSHALDIKEIKTIQGLKGCNKPEKDKS